MKIAVKKNALAGLIWVMFLIAAPTALYVNHVYDQLREVRENNLRTLSKAAETTNQILQTAVGNVKNLESSPEFACEFANRQPYLEWGGTVTCERAEIPGEMFKQAYLKASAAGAQVLQRTTSGNPDPRFVFNVQFDALLAAIPFSDALDLLFIADSKGNVIHQHQPEGRLDVGLLVSSLGGLPVRNSEAVTENAAMQKASSINNLQFSGVDYQLLCQPLMLNRAGYADDVDDMLNAPGNWVLCGLVASERSTRQSLLVAPVLAFTLFAVTVFGFLTWPAIKLLWMTKSDRLYFADLCFLTFGTWGGLMLATILILGIGSYRILVSSSESSLRQLAYQIESNLETEIEELTTALREMDSALSKVLNDGIGTETDIDHLYATAPSSDVGNTRYTLSNAVTRGWPLKSDFNMVFWAQCNGQQVLKATVNNDNTPRVNIGHRNYFKAVVRDRLWQGRAPNKDEQIPRFVEPIRSVTTGKFATVISIPSQVPMQASSAASEKNELIIATPDCPGIVALQAALVSTSNPVLPPGVGFAIIDAAGNVVLHSDERRALFENLYEEMEQGDRLHSMVLARSEQRMTTGYLGRSHQLFVKPLDRVPWTIVTFSDREMITTANLEVLGHAIVIAFIFLAFYGLLTVVYFLVRGSEIPLWFWPGSHKTRLAPWLLGVTAITFVALILIVSTVDGDDIIRATFILPSLIFIGIFTASRRASDGDSNENVSDVHVSQVRWSIASSLIIWTVVAIIPAGVFFNSALNSQARLLVRYENEFLVDQMVGRNCAIDDYYQSIDRSGVCEGGALYCRFSERRSVDAGDIYPSSMFWPRPVHDPDWFSGLAKSDKPPTLRVSDRFLPTDPPIRYDSVDLRIPGNEGVDCKSSVEDRGDIWSLFPQAKPIYNSTVIRSRYLTPDAESGVAHNTNWTWQPNAEGCASIFTATALACDTTIALKSGLPSRRTVYGNPATLLGGALLFTSLFFWARYGARRVFFGNLRMPPLRDRQELELILLEKENDSETRLIVIAASQADRFKLLKSSTDQEKSNEPESTPDQALSKSRGQFARHDMTDYFGGDIKRDDLLKDLEEDIKARKNILIVSPTDPYGLLNTDEPSTTTNDQSNAALIAESHKQDEILHRWRQALSLFRVVILTFNKSPPTPASTTIWQRGLDREVDDRWIKAEIEAIPELSPLYELLRAELLKSSRRNALDRIVERAFGCYMALWDACTEKEKLVLVQIASENVVNPKQVSVVRRLMQQGYLVRDPGLRMVNQSFAQFVTQIQEPSQVLEWERRSSGVSWVHTRWALFGVLLLGLLFLWTTQREMFNSTIMFLSAAAVSIPGLIKGMTNLSKMGSHGAN